jgi:lipoprotein signal peptidase
MKRLFPASPLERLAVIAGIAFLTDFVSKAWAVQFLDPENGVASHVLGLHLAIINNDGLAWGLKSGIALELTAVLTLVLGAVAVRVCNSLTEIDDGAPLAFGLLLGAGAANLADALVPPSGVVDFIAVTKSDGWTTTFNLADVAAAIGLVLCGRTVLRISLALREHRPILATPRPAAVDRLMPARARMLLSGGHALVGMCVFVWLYSMVLAWMPEAGRSAPNSLLCGLGAFAATFVVSQLRMRRAAREEPAVAEARPRRRLTRLRERVVLDSSVAYQAHEDQPEPAPNGRRKDQVVELPDGLGYSVGRVLHMVREDDKRRKR